MYTMHDFIEQKIAVSFANRAERIEFLKMCQKEGLRWDGKISPTNSFATGKHLDGHQIECGYPDKRKKYLTHSNAGSHKIEGWKTVPFSEFQQEETIGVNKRNGNTITVHMGDLHGTAKCSTDDEYDLYTGCDLALRRALEKEAEALKKARALWNALAGIAAVMDYSITAIELKPKGGTNRYYKDATTKTPEKRCEK